MKAKRHPLLCVLSNLSDFIYMSKFFLVYINKYKINLHIKFALQCHLHTWLFSPFYKLVTLSLMQNFERSWEMDWASGDLSSVQSLSRVQLFATPWTTACQASLSITNSWSPPKPMSIESVMPSNYLILCCPLLLLPSIFPSTGSFPMS